MPIQKTQSIKSRMQSRINGNSPNGGNHPPNRPVSRRSMAPISYSRTGHRFPVVVNGAVINHATGRQTPVHLSRQDAQQIARHDQQNAGRNGLRNGFWNPAYDLPIRNGNWNPANEVAPGLGQWNAGMAPWENPQMSVNVPFSGPSMAPFNVPFNDPFNVPINAPFNVPLNAPFNLPLNDPFNVPLNAPFGMALNDPFNMPLIARPMTMDNGAWPVPSPHAAGFRLMVTIISFLVWL